MTKYYKTSCAYPFNTDKIAGERVHAVQNCCTISLSEELSKKLHLEDFQNN